jgi:hypothetical protein
MLVARGDVSLQPELAQFLDRWDLSQLSFLGLFLRGDIDTLFDEDPILACLFPRILQRQLWIAPQHLLARPAVQAKAQDP